MATSYLHQAARNGDVERIKEDVKEREDLFKYDHEGLQPLHAAAECGRVEAVKLLLELGADVEARSWPYYWEIGEPRWDGKKLRYDESKRFEDRPCGGTALHLAAEFGWVEVVRLLLDRGARVSARDENGQTPLHLAVGENRFEAAELLVSRGADLEALDCNEWPPRHWLFVHYGHGQRIAFEDNGYLRWTTLLGPKHLSA